MTMDIYTQGFSLISASIGGLLVIIGSFGVAIYNQSKNLRRLRNERDSKRLEDLYKVTARISHMYKKLWWSAILKITNNAQIASNFESDLSPIFELEMMVRLYFPTLLKTFTDFTEAMEKFGSKLSEIMGKDFRQCTIKEKQKENSIILELYESIEERLKSIQSEIVQLVKMVR